MSLPSEIVNQSIFTAALFLTLISVPKLALLTIWFTYRMLAYRLSERMVKSRYFRKLIIQKNIFQALEKLAENPAERIAQMGKEYEHFTKDIRDPIIEAIVASVIMVLIYPIFPQIQTWLVFSFVVIVAVILWAFALLLLFLKDINRLPVQKEAERS